MTKTDKIYKIRCTYDMTSKNITFGMLPIRCVTYPLRPLSLSNRNFVNKAKISPLGKPTCVRTSALRIGGSAAYPLLHNGDCLIYAEFTYFLNLRVLRYSECTGANTGKIDCLVTPFSYDCSYYSVILPFLKFFNITSTPLRKLWVDSWVERELRWCEVYGCFSVWWMSFFLQTCSYVL